MGTQVELVDHLKPNLQPLTFVQFEYCNTLVPLSIHLLDPFGDTHLRSVKM